MPSGENGRLSYYVSSTDQDKNPEHSVHHHLTVLPVCSLDCLTGKRCLPPQRTQLDLVAFTSNAKSASQAQSLTQPVCRSVHELFLKSSQCSTKYSLFSEREDPGYVSLTVPD